MKRLELVGWIGLSALLAAYGCSVETKTVVDDSGAGGSTTAGATGGPGVTSSTTGPMTSSSTGTPVMDESTSCGDAVALDEQMNAAGGIFLDGQGALAAAEDKDYYKFTAKKGDWLLLGTEANPDDDPAMVDTVITLLDAGGTTQLAQVDDSFPRISTDSEMFYRVPEDGTYCLEVQEFSDWANESPEGDPSFVYRAFVVPIDPTLYEGYDLDTGDNDTTGMAQKLTGAIVDTNTNQIFDRIYGALEPQTDKDVFEVTVPEGGLGLSIDFTPSGEEGFGATTPPGLINVYDGATLLAQLDYADGSDGFSSVPVEANKTYFFEVNRPAGANLGSNDTYFFKLFTSDTLNPQEMDESGNGDSANAEVASGTVNPNDSKVLNHFIGGNVPAGDTDWWTIEAKQNDEIVVVCSSRRAGSGVADMTVALYKDPAGSALESETESKSAELLWSTTAPDASKPGVTATTTGTYYVKISSTMMVANGATSDFYLCGVHAISP